VANIKKRGPKSRPGKTPVPTDQSCEAACLPLVAADIFVVDGCWIDCQRRGLTVDAETTMILQEDTDKAVAASYSSTVVSQEDVLSLISLGRQRPMSELLCSVGKCELSSLECTELVSYFIFVSLVDLLCHKGEHRGYRLTSKSTQHGHQRVQPPQVGIFLIIRVLMNSATAKTVPIKLHTPSLYKLLESRALAK